MEDIKIRKATKDDIMDILRLHLKLADYHAKIDKYYKKGKDMKKESLKMIKERIIKRSSIILVIEKEEKIIGFFRGGIESPKGYAAPKRIGRLTTAFIEKEYRGKGLSKMVFAELMKWFKKKKIKYVELSVDARNETGKKAWNDLGFKEYMKLMRIEL